jgi:hypothetical protein
VRAWAKGLLCLEAAVELLIGHGAWLSRPDFLQTAVEPGTDCGRVMAYVDFTLAVRALDAGVLAGSDGEKGVLRVAAGIAAGCPVDLRDALTGLDAANAVLVAAAVLHASGHRVRDAVLGCGEGRR